MARLRSRGVAVLAATLSAGAIGVVGALAPAAPAAADDQTFCGRQIEQINPGSDGIGALNQLLNQGEDNNIQMLAQALQQGTWICEPARFAMKMASGVVVGDAVLDVFELNIPTWADVLIEVVKTATEGNDQELPAQLPDVGPATIPAPVSWTGGIGVAVRPEPNRDLPKLAAIPEGETVNIECTAQGATVAGPDGATSVWDRVTYNGVTGFVTDAYLNTGTNDAVAPAC